MPWTREDQLASQRRWYARNPRRQIDWGHRRRVEMKAWLAAKKPMCRECGESRVGCLGFHHLDPTAKEIELSVAIHAGWSKKRLERELAKCIVLCGNCHAKLHWNERRRAHWGLIPSAA